MVGLSPRLRAVVQALQLREGMRVVEIGCGPGAAARAVADLVGATGHVLAVDRSAKAIEQVVLTAGGLIAEGRLSVRQVAVEDLALQSGEAPYDLAFAVRVGALDGRFPEAGAEALRRASGGFEQ
jgi:precorrin-6B methylase 2